MRRTLPILLCVAATRALAQQPGPTGVGNVTIGSGVTIGNYVTIGLQAAPPVPPPAGATGDSRTVTQPSMPTSICSQVAATKYIILTNAVNIDPYNLYCGTTGGSQGTLGCTGGNDYQPSSSSSSYVAAETLDNTAVQNAINACASGSAVELVPGASGQLGFVLSPWHLTNGVSVLIDPGIHVFASRNVSDYGGTNCGQVTTGTSSCNHWITAPSTTNSGIYGFGTLDGRGWSAYTGGSTPGFYYNRIQAYCNNHGGASHGSPGCTVNSSGNNSYGPNLMNLVGANSFTLYGPTLKDAGNFFINWQNSNGFTAWDTKIIGPFEVSNTDGWDPLNSTNGTFTHSYSSNGDNMMAIKATSGAASNITYSFNQTSAGIAIAIGSATQFGVSNVLVTDNVQNGNLFNDQSAGLMIGSSTANGGTVNLVNFQRDCMMNEQNSIRLYTNYGGQTGSNTPNYQNILIQDVHVLASTAPYTTGNSGTYTFQGLNGTPILAQVNNLTIDGTNQGIAQQSGVTKDQYSTIKLGPGAVPSSVISQFNAGTSVTQIGSVGSSTPYTCTTSMWQPLIGELNLKNATANYNSSLSQASPNPYTLQAVLEPATSISIKESKALTGNVHFLDNGTDIGNAPLIGDDTLAQLTISSPPLGSHVYQAYYSDANYPAFTFGSISVNSALVATAQQKHHPKRKHHRFWVF